MVPAAQSVAFVRAWRTGPRAGEPADPGERAQWGCLGRAVDGGGPWREGGQLTKDPSVIFHNSLQGSSIWYETGLHLGFGTGG